MNIAIISMILALWSAMSQPTTSLLHEGLDSPECKQWVDSVFSNLSEREKVAQLVITNVSPTGGEASKAVIKGLVEKEKVGGLLFSAGPLSAYASLTNFAQKQADVPLLMTLDGEWGIAMRVPDAPLFPKNMGLGAIRDSKLLYEYGQEMARECRALGIHVNFAPVLDVNSNPQNPVIGFRSFGEDPDRVSKLGVAYSCGLEDGGVMAVAKHFPGHGDTSTDSHKTLPVVDHSLETLQDVDLLPFRNFINSGCNGVMVGHLTVEALDPSLRASSMSRPITTEWLKEKMGFDGLVFTDGLAMQGANLDENNCVAALKAGADMLVGPRNVPRDIEAVLKAIKDGELSQPDIDAKCKKVLAYKYALGIPFQPEIKEEKIDSILHSAASAEVKNKLADAMVTVLRNKENLLPLARLDTAKIAIVSIGRGKDNAFEKMCLKYANADIYSDKSLGASTIQKLKEYDVVVGAVFNDSLTSRNALTSLSSLEGLLPVFMVNPYKANKFKSSVVNSKAVILAYDDTEECQRAAAKAIFGGIDIDGRLPVNLPGLGKLGEGCKIRKNRLGYANPRSSNFKSNLEYRLDSAITAAMKEGAFPGCQLLVAKDGNVLIEKAYGHTTKGGQKVTTNTLYDLASVSKAVGTLPGIMKAYDMELFSLEQPVSDIIEGMRIEGKSDITPMMLLFHESGMQPTLNMYPILIDSTSYKGKLLSSRKDKAHPIKIYDRLYGPAGTKMRSDLSSKTRTDIHTVEAAKDVWVGQVTYDTIMSRIYQSPQRKNRNCTYSCLNFCLLMDMEQRLTGQSHENWINDSIWAPLGAYGFCYRPTENRKGWDIASTERDNYLRKQHLKGYAHDELAAFSGGVQGNAGVFGTASDIAKLCQMWLNGGWYGDKRFFSESTSLLFTMTKSANSRRGLGFDKPDISNPDKSPTCKEASPEVYGHLGYTGTCFWVDPELDLIFVFLCNRVDPTRNNPAFTKSEIRPTLFSIIYQSLGENN